MKSSDLNMTLHDQLDIHTANERFERLAGLSNWPVKNVWSKSSRGSIGHFQVGSILTPSSWQRDYNQGLKSIGVVQESHSPIRNASLVESWMPTSWPSAPLTIHWLCTVGRGHRTPFHSMISVHPIFSKFHFRLIYCIDLLDSMCTSAEVL